MVNGIKIENIFHKIFILEIFLLRNNMNIVPYKNIYCELCDNKIIASKKCNMRFCQRHKNIVKAFTKFKEGDISEKELNVIIEKQKNLYKRKQRSRHNVERRRYAHL